MKEKIGHMMQSSRLSLLMKRMKLLPILLLVQLAGHAQEMKPAFWYDIQAFKQKDSIQMPAAGQILFVGSSSFTKWTSVQEDFPGYKIINRGFGGSSLPDVIRYANDIIFPYKPKQVVIYCGDNDLVASDTVTASMVAQRFKVLFQMIRKRLPRARISFISIKPSPSRRRLMPRMLEANTLIRQFLRKKPRTDYIDIYHKMLVDGEPRPDIFVEDNLHMNSKGYEIWQTTIEPFLLK